MEIKENDVRPDPIGISSSSRSDKEPTKNENVATSVTNNVVVADRNMLKTTSSILLLGTQHSNKHLLKRSIINGDYTIEKTKNLKIVVDSKSREVLLQIAKPSIGNFLNIELQDFDKISLHYTKRGDQVIKLVDGPVFEAHNVHKFNDDIKKCIVLSQEGYNSIIVAFTADRVRECNLLLNILHDNFSVNRNNVFPMLIYENEYKFATKMIKEYNAILNEYQVRFIKYNIENHTKEMSTFFTLVNQITTTCTSHLLCKNKENFLQYGEWEEILKEIYLLLEKALIERISMQNEVEELLEHLKLLWSEFQGSNDDRHLINDSFDNERDKGETKGLGTTIIQTDTKQRLVLDSSLIEDIIHIMEILCLRNIYFDTEPMRKCKEMLMHSFQERYQRFHDWYVRTVIKDRDNLLNRNIMQKLSKGMN
ncbi:uncharacterized protein LOC131939381 [Physella acuta]|uniref:uncharacterized protein LOC131939381 n=1 Tax=Physella acuta TaxID=109671 RepID=UPI0027DC4283|nr:uncharacterized protein LOC131939381 [Physella acuta]